MIENGNSFNLLKTLKNNSIDAIVTDPPYGMSFMNHEWDDLNTTDFRKDTRGNENRLELLNFFTPIWRECLRVIKPGSFALVLCSPRQDLMAQQILALSEAGFDTRYTPIFWAYASGFPKAQNIANSIGKKVGLENKQTYEQNKLLEEIKALNGSYAGFQPKPAVEPVLVAMKPLSEKTYADQALTNGKGITWLDNGRIPYVSQDDYLLAMSAHREPDTYYRRDGRKKITTSGGKSVDINGRFPANLLVSDDVLNDGISRISGGVGGRPNHDRGKGYGFKPMKEKSPNVPCDEGSFSKYFDLDKWYEKHIASLPDYVRKVFPFLIVPKPVPNEKEKGLDDGRNASVDDAFQKGEILKKNIHPTVKPVKLMSYLVSIATKNGDVVLDPFMGSGTTGVACKILGREFVGFELKKEYFEIAQNRIGMLPMSTAMLEEDDE